jgi:hypothetical protein
MSKKSYDWQYATVGGVPRVDIKSGADIAHLGELDQKMWTVLSCPVKDLEIDTKTLQMMDKDNDGKIRVNEVVEAAEWATKVLKDPELLLKQQGTLPLAAINQDTDEGKKIYNSAKEILKNLGLTKDSISIEDTADSLAIFAKTRFNGDGVITVNSTDDEALKAIIDACIKTIGSSPDRSGEAGVTAEQLEAFYTACADYTTWLASADADKAANFPYGDNTAAALAAFKTLQDKINDYFMRCKLAAFDEDSTAALDVSVARFEAISDKNLATCNDEISSYPLARVSKKKELPLVEGINPAWEGAFAELKRLVFDVDFPKQKTLSEEDWQSVVAKFKPYETWLSQKKGEVVESLGADVLNTIVAKNQKDALLSLVAEDKALEAEAQEIEAVDKMLHLCRDLFRLIKNYVTFTDFYSRDKDNMAIFQAGTLFVDQRSCDLCIRVTDMAKHNTMATYSGMYLLYCDCYSKQKNETMTIVAVMTDGDVDDLLVGKNAIFYDRDGLDWDAKIVKIIDNPISIRQAFWAPYKKFANWVTGLINKSAAEKDSKSFDTVTKSVTEKTETAAVPDKPADPAKAQPFDIAKFAGIFAAIGMALGFIGSFVVSVVSGFAKLSWWQAILAFVAILLLISGPSMIMAWLKLRKRNLAPLLDSNGWAVNARAYVNITFGATLTKIAAFPTVVLQDPYADKGMPMWKKILITVVFLIIVFGVLYFLDVFAFLGFPFHEAPAAVVDTLQKATDTLATHIDTTAIGK